MAVRPLSWFVRLETRFPGVYRGVFTLLPLIVAMVGVSLVVYAPELTWPIPPAEKARYGAGWVLFAGFAAVTPLWVANRHPKGWWKAILPALIVLGWGCLQVVAAYGGFYPTDVGGTGAAVIYLALFGVYAVAAIPVTALVAYLIRRAGRRDADRADGEPPEPR